MKNNFIFITILGLFGIVGCFKEEMPTRIAAAALDSKFVQIDCNNEANQMVFFDFSTGQNYSAPNANWHLAFDSRAEGNSLRVNLTKANYHLYASNSSNFNIDIDEIITLGEEVMDSVSDWYFNNAIRNLDHNPSKVYAYVQEPDLNGSPQEKIKFQIIETTDKTYSIKFINQMLIGAKPVDFGFDKNKDYNFNYFSFYNGGKIVQVEPYKEDWDIVFTQYRDMVKFEQDNQFYPYQVLGTLINPLKTSVYEMPNNTDFRKVDHTACDIADWCKTSNAIGFDWKYYSLNNGVYSTDTSKVWLLTDQKDNSYKMRFVNYYNSNGHSGYPSFEYTMFK